jgi:hypothetical protein
MGKSKYSLKAQKKIQTGGNHQKKGRHVYYDEKIASKGSGMSKNIFVLIIGIMVIGAGTGAYFLLTGNNDSNDTTITDDGLGEDGGTTIPEDGLQEGDSFRAHYKLWVADMSGPDGVIDTNEPPYQDSTSGDPFESTTGQVIEGFKNNILGLKEGEEITFTLESGEGYTSGDLANYRLTFWVKIVEIL